MGFWVMLLSIILGLCLIIIGVYSKKQTTNLRIYLKKASIIIGIISVGFAIYLGWPK